MKTHSPELVRASKLASKAALRSACRELGVSIDQLAMACGSTPRTARSWVDPTDDSAIPYHAVLRLRLTLPRVVTLLESLLAEPAEGVDEEASVLDAARACASVVLTITTPARQTREGARAALVSIAHATAAQQRLTPVLRAIAERVAA